VHPLKSRKGSYIDYKNGFGMIKLTQGKFSIVDIDDYEKVVHFRWFAVKSGRTFYAMFRKIKLPHLIIKCPTGKMIVHINGNGLDNRKSNIRVCDIKDNKKNRRSYKNKSGFKGVTWLPKRKYYQVCIGVPKKYLGAFTDKVEAAKAFDREALKMYGEFAQTNFPKESYQCTN